MRFLAVFFVIFSLTGGQALADSAVCSKDPSVQGGDSRPWPWGFETPFPWERIQGIWAPIAGVNSCSSYFVFKVGNRTDEGSRFIRITEYDPSTCKKVSSGVGVESEKVIYAQMADGKNSFNLTIRAFDPEVLKEKLMCDGDDDGGIFPAPTSAKAVIVLTTYPQYRWNEGTSYEMSKLQSSTAMVCEDPKD